MFTFRTVGINAKAYRTLIQRKGVVNRNWAFEEDSLEELLESTPNTFKKNFKEYIPKSMRDVKEFPANQDLTEFADIVTLLVRKMLCIIYDSPDNKWKATPRLMRNMSNDSDLQKFLGVLADELGLVQTRDLSSFTDIVYVFLGLSYEHEIPH
ncbi:MAG: hypothetical protein SGARI_005489 [Bacillariaceae sp.]